jgi:hypothetical protein
LSFKNTGINNFEHNTKVKIVQKWNAIRPPIPREVIEEFRTYFIIKKLKYFEVLEIPIELKLLFLQLRFLA